MTLQATRPTCFELAFLTMIPVLIPSRLFGLSCDVVFVRSFILNNKIKVSKIKMIERPEALNLLADTIDVVFNILFIRLNSIKVQIPWLKPLVFFLERLNPSL